MKTIDEMTKKEFNEVPSRGWNEDVGVFDSLVILPGLKSNMHDSGYRCMDFVAVKDNKPLRRLSGCSDVIHIEGIGGYGKNWLQKYKCVPKTTDVVSWSIDCLATSGLLRIFPGTFKMSCGPSLSSFEIYSEPDDPPAADMS